MGILFFDTETTGKRLPKVPVSDDRQPNLVQLAAILTDDNLNEVSSVNCIVYPYNWTISDEVAAIHGISQEKAERYGVGLTAAVRMFADLADNADRFAAHNEEFDTFIMRRAAHLAGGYTEDFFAGKKVMCTMRAATPVVQILHKAPRHAKDWKYPKLEECYRHFFNEELVGAHDALNDVRATIRVYRALCEHYGMNP